jgi:hypothetical protein
MLKSAILAGALLCVLSINAEARQRHRFQPACIETGTNLQPSCMGNDFLAGVKIRVVLHREGPVHKANKHRHKSRVSALQGPPHHNTYSSNSITRPIRYIAGRLVCALNLNAALAERGIKGTGSALAHSFDHWGIRVAYPVPGAVAVTDRRGGGHVAYVARVDPDGRVFAWNPSPRGRGWELVEYTHRHARYRVAGI